MNQIQIGREYTPTTQPQPMNEDTAKRIAAALERIAACVTFLMGGLLAVAIVSLLK